MLTYADALLDKHLLGALPQFADTTTWSRWLVFLRAVEGLPLTSDEQAIFCHHTGRSAYDPPPGGWREVLAMVGRQSGKSQIGVGVIQPVDALRGQAGTFAANVAQDSRAAMRTLFGYAAEAFDTVPLLRQQVRSRTQDSIALMNGVTLSVYPCRPSALRGIRASIVVLDEAAFFMSSEGRAVDAEMMRAARPATLTTGGRIVVLSSPYGQSGVVFDLFRRHYGRDESPVLVWRGRSDEMNPTLRESDLARLRAEDPEAYESEIGAEFRSGLSLLFDAESIDRCVAEGVKERLPVPGIRYVCGVDLSGGRRDRAAVCVVHVRHDQVIVDAIRSWTPPFSPVQVITEVAGLARAYGCSDVYGDAFGANFVTDQFAQAGITYRSAAGDRSALYVQCVPIINSRRVVLLDNRLLTTELKALERRRGPSGRDRVDHRVGAHDDLANAAAVAIVEAHRRRIDPAYQPIRVRPLAGFGDPMPAGPPIWFTHPDRDCSVDPWDVALRARFEQVQAARRQAIGNN